MPKGVYERAAKFDLRGRVEAILSKTLIGDGCWDYHGHVNRGGYGIVTSSSRSNGDVRKKILTHRIMYTALRGEIPVGKVIDHLCRNRRCVNPDHLEPVTIAENVLRGEGIAARLRRVTHCIRGHPFDQANTYVRPDNGDRQCRTCRSELSARRWIAKRAVKAAGGAQ